MDFIKNKQFLIRGEVLAKDNLPVKAVIPIQIDTAAAENFSPISLARVVLPT